MTMICFKMSCCLKNRREGRLPFAKRTAVCLMPPLVFRDDKVRSLYTLPVKTPIAQNRAFETAFLRVDVPIKLECFDKCFIAVELDLNFVNKNFIF